MAKAPHGPSPVMPPSATHCQAWTVPLVVTWDESPHRSVMRAPCSLAVASCPLSPVSLSLLWLHHSSQMFAFSSASCALVRTISSPALARVASTSLSSAGLSTLLFWFPARLQGVTPSHGAWYRLVFSALLTQQPISFLWQQFEILTT